MKAAGLTIFRQLAEVGLFAHLTPDELAALERLARKSTALMLNDFLRELLTAARDTIVWAPEFGGVHLHPADFLWYILQLQKLARDQFHMDDFQSQSVEIVKWDRPLPYVLLQATFNGQAYEFNCPSIQHAITGPLADLLNRVLADVNADGRLFPFELLHPLGAGPRSGLLYLTPARAERLKKARLSRVRPVGSWSTRAITDLLDGLEDLGLFSHLTTRIIMQTRRELFRDDVSSALIVLTSFPDVCDIFDAECIDDPAQDYAAPVRRIGAITHGLFVVDDFAVRAAGDDAHILYSFTWRGEPATGRLQIRGDWIDLEYCHTINALLRKAQIDGQLYPIDTGDQSACLVYLSDAQYRQVATNRLFPVGRPF
jgi:hypothetical protein